MEHESLAGKEWWQIYGWLRRSTVPICMFMLLHKT